MSTSVHVAVALATMFPGFTPEEAQAAKGDGSPGTALMLRPEAIVSERMIGELLRLAGAVFYDPTKKGRAAETLQRGVERARSRLHCRKDGTPVVEKVTFAARERSDGSFAGAVARVHVDIGGGTTVPVEVYPLVVLDISFPYVVKHTDGTWRSPVAFPCILFAPGGDKHDQQKKPWQALPIGLVDESLVMEFNARNMGKGDTLHKLDHGLTRPGGRHLVWTPEEYEEETYPRGKARPETVVRLGYYAGKKVIKQQGSTNPPWVSVKQYKETLNAALQQEAEATGRKLKQKHFETIEEGDETAPHHFESCVFEVVERPNHILVRVLGREGEVDIGRTQIEFERPVDTFDPLALIGQTHLQVDRHKLQARIDALISGIGRDGVLNLSNAAVAYGMRHLGVVRESDSVEAARTTLVPFLRRAKDRVQEEMDQVFSLVSGKLLGAIVELSVDDVLGGKDRKVVERRREGPDAVAEWIEAKTGAKFVWTSPLHREVRSWVLGHVLPKEEKQKSAEEAPASS